MRLKGISDKYCRLPAVAKASFWFFTCNVMQKAVQMLTVPIITRMLSTSEYGVYSVFNSYSNILIVFATIYVFGNGYYVGMKKYGRDKYRYTSAVAGLMLLLTTACFLLYLTASDEITAVTGLGKTVWILLFVWMYGQGAINLWFVENRYEFKYRMIVACTLFTAAATPLLKIILIRLCGKAGADKSLGAILGLVIPVAAVGAVALAVMFFKGRSACVKEYWKFALAFNIPLIPYYLSQTVLNQADRIMIERMDSAGNAGIYSVAYSLAMAMTVISSAVNNTFIPWQFKKMENGEHRRVAGTVNLIMLVMAGCHLLLIFAAPEIMRIFAAKEYFEAIYVIPPVTIGVLLIWLTQLFINVEFYYEKNKLIALSSVLSAALNVILNAAAIPRYGYLAAGYTTLICYLANMIFHGAVAVKLTKEMKAERAFDLGKIVMLTVGCLVGMFILTILYRYMFVRYMILSLFIMILLIQYKNLKQLLYRIWETIRYKT